MGRQRAVLRSRSIPSGAARSKAITGPLGPHGDGHEDPSEQEHEADDHDLHPATHDEPPLYLPLFDLMFRMPEAMAFFTEEERDLVDRRFRFRGVSEVIGIGADLDAVGNARRFREAYGIGDAPYLLYVGRLISTKGVHAVIVALPFLLERYPDLRFGLVDAVVMAVAERLEAEAIVTLDVRHFGAVELHHDPRLLPRDG